MWTNWWSSCNESELDAFTRSADHGYVRRPACRGNSSGRRPGGRPAAGRRGGVVIPPASSPAGVQTDVAARQAVGSQSTGAPQPAGNGVAETGAGSESTPTVTEEQQKEQFLTFKRELIAYALPFALSNRPAELYSDLAIEQLQTRSDPGLALLHVKHGCRSLRRSMAKFNDFNRAGIFRNQCVQQRLACSVGVSPTRAK
jgi:hypothetical protein